MNSKFLFLFILSFLALTNFNLDDANIKTHDLGINERLNQQQTLIVINDDPILTPNSPQQIILQITNNDEVNHTYRWYVNSLSKYLVFKSTNDTEYSTGIAHNITIYNGSMREVYVSAKMSLDSEIHGCVAHYKVVLKFASEQTSANEEGHEERWFWVINQYSTIKDFSLSDEGYLLPLTSTFPYKITRSNDGTTGTLTVTITNDNDATKYYDVNLGDRSIYLQGINSSFLSFPGFRFNLSAGSTTEVSIDFEVKREDGSLWELLPLEIIIYSSGSEIRDNDEPSVKYKFFIVGYMSTNALSGVDFSAIERVGKFTELNDSFIEIEIKTKTIDWSSSPQVVILSEKGQYELENIILSSTVMKSTLEKSKVFSSGTYSTSIFLLFYSPNPAASQAGFAILKIDLSKEVYTNESPSFTFFLTVVSILSTICFIRFRKSKPTVRKG